MYLDDFLDGVVAWLGTVVILAAYEGGRLGWSESRGLLYAS